MDFLFCLADRPCAWTGLPNDCLLYIFNIYTWGIFVNKGFSISDKAKNEIENGVVLNTNTHVNYELTDLMPANENKKGV